MAMTDVDATDAAAPDGRGLGGKTVAPWARACVRARDEQERRGCEGEKGRRGRARREERRRPQGRSLTRRAPARSTNRIHPNPCVHLLACVRECGARASRIEGWARGWNCSLRAATPRVEARP